MGCYPLGKIISKALQKCNGRERRRKRRLDYAMAYPPTQTCYMRPMARTVTFSNNNSVYMIPPEPAQSQTEPENYPTQPEPAVPVPPPVETPKTKESARVRFAPKPEPQQVPRTPNRMSEPSPAHPAYGYRYMPSPLSRGEATPKRHEYFSGEYRYYPTPVREGIYNIATDANRLTTIFSEENPNACTIV